MHTQQRRQDRETVPAHHAFTTSPTVDIAPMADAEEERAWDEIAAIIAARRTR